MEPSAYREPGCWTIRRKTVKLRRQCIIKLQKADSALLEGGSCSRLMYESILTSDILYGEIAVNVKFMIMLQIKVRSTYRGPAEH